MALEFTYIVLDARDHALRDPISHDPVQYSTRDDAERAIVDQAVGRGARVVPFCDWIDTDTRLN